MNKLLLLTVILLLCNWKAYARNLPRFNEQNLQDFDAELVGKYHTDAFESLKNKYEGSHNLPSNALDVMADMKEILKDYCTSDDMNEYTSCIQKVNKYTGEKDLNNLDHESTNSFFLHNKMDRLEQVIKNGSGREKTLAYIQSVEQEILSDDGTNAPGLVAVSIAKESFELWHDVLTNENHSFHRLNEGRSLQFDFCTDPFILVSADIDGGIQALDDGDFIDIITSAVLASAQKFFAGCPVITDAPTALITDIPSALPSLSPSISPEPSVSMAPSLSPTQSPEPSSIIHPSSAPTESSASPSLSFSPTVGEETLNEIITCIAIIDESYESSFSFFRNRWDQFRQFYPDRPFCLLQPAIFTTDENYAYPQGVVVGDGIFVPENFYDDDNTIFAAVNRDNGDADNLSDWFEICNLAGLRESGIARVAFFIDESGSMDRTVVQASFDLFEEKIEIEGITVVGAIYNEDEEWVLPFLTNFGFDGPSLDLLPDDDLCRKADGGQTFQEKVKSLLRNAF